MKFLSKYELKEIEIEGEWLRLRNLHKTKCKQKIQYKTCREAEEAKRALEKKFDTELKIYICPLTVRKKEAKRHYHIATK